MYRLFVDSADDAHVLPLLRSGVVQGVTTNPTILRRGERRLADLPDLYARWVDAGAQRVFFQAWGDSQDDLQTSADRIVGFGERVGVKVPANAAGFAVGAALANRGVPVLVTAVYSPAQAVAASAIGAECIAPYLGRLDDSGADGAAVIAHMHDLLQGTSTYVLAASIRSTDALIRLADVGVRAMTAAPDVIRGLLTDAASDSAITVFGQDTLAIGG